MLFRSPTSDELFQLLAGLLVLVIISVRRYTDVWLRTRRVQPLSAAAEAQWALLPPLAAISADVTVSGHPLCVAPGFPATVAHSKTLTYKDHGQSWNLSGRNGLHSAFAYQN